VPAYTGGDNGYKKRPGVAEAISTSTANPVNIILSNNELTITQ
jgi:hypothetical protein